MANLDSSHDFQVKVVGKGHTPENYMIEFSTKILYF